MMICSPFVEHKPKRLNTSSSIANSDFNAWKPLKNVWALTRTLGTGKTCFKNTVYSRKNCDSKLQSLATLYTLFGMLDDAIWHKRVMTAGRVVGTIKADSKIRFASLC